MKDRLLKVVFGKVLRVLSCFLLSFSSVLMMLLFVEGKKKKAPGKPRTQVGASGVLGSHAGVPGSALGDSNLS